MNRITQFKSGRGVSATRQVCNLENGVQIPAPDPISPPLVDGRGLSAAGSNHEQKGTIQELLTSQLCIPGHLRLVWLRLRSVRPSSRWSSGRVGLKSCFGRPANPGAVGLRVAMAGLVIAGCASCGAHPVYPIVPGIGFGRVVPQPSFWWWFSEISVNTSIAIGLFWLAWVVSGDRNKKDK